MVRKPEQVYLTVFFLIVISTVILESLGPIALKNIDQSQIITLLGSLFVIALFLERALEVFVATSRSPGAMKLDYKIAIKEQALKALIDSGKSKDSKVIVEENNELSLLRQQRESYRLETKKTTLWAGLMFGVLISAVGIRTLSTLVNDIASLSTSQQSFFNIVDVFITGGLLAGGSDGIHKLAKVYSNYMDNLANSIKNPSS